AVDTGEERTVRGVDEDGGSAHGLEGADGGVDPAGNHLAGAVVTKGIGGNGHGRDAFGKRWFRVARNPAVSAVGVWCDRVMWYARSVRVVLDPMDTGIGPSSATSVRARAGAAAKRWWTAELDANRTAPRGDRRGHAACRAATAPSGQRGSYSDMLCKTMPLPVNREGSRRVLVDPGWIRRRLSCTGISSRKPSRDASPRGTKATRAPSASTSARARSPMRYHGFAHQAAGTERPTDFN